MKKNLERLFNSNGEIVDTEEVNEIEGAYKEEQNCLGGNFNEYLKK